MGNSHREDNQLEESEAADQQHCFYKEVIDKHQQVDQIICMTSPIPVRLHQSIETCRKVMTDSVTQTENQFISNEPILQNLSLQTTGKRLTIKKFEKNFVSLEKRRFDYQEKLDSLIRTRKLIEMAPRL